MKVALDPCSSTDEFTKAVSTHDSTGKAVRVQSRDMVSMSGKPVISELSFNNKTLRVKGHETSRLPLDCVAPLSRPTLRFLTEKCDFDFGPRHMLCGPGQSIPMSIKKNVTHEKTVEPPSSSIASASLVEPPSHQPSLSGQSAKNFENFLSVEKKP